MNIFLSSNFDGELDQGGIDEDGDPEDLGEHGDGLGSPSHRDLWDTGALAYLSSPDGDELYSYKMPHTTSIPHHTITQSQLWCFRGSRQSRTGTSSRRMCSSAETALASSLISGLLSHILRSALKPLHALGPF